MANDKVCSIYQKNAIMTAKPEELTLMLYNGLIKFIVQAQKAIEKKDVPAAHENIIKSENIIRAFQMTLDMKYELSQKEMPLYNYLYRRLVEANLKKDTQILNEVLGFVTELRDTWAQAMKNMKTESLSKVAVSAGR